MNSNSSISIVLTTYNGVNFVNEQLDSILNQTHKNYELIIVDDCSTDGTIEILKEYAEKHQNILLHINKTNVGVNKSFEKAIDLSTSPYIAISDQDDIWLDNKLDTLINNIGNHMLIYSHSTLIDNMGVSLNRTKFRDLLLYQGSDSRSLVFNNRVAGHTVLFNSFLKQYILPIPKHCHYDAWIALCAANFGSIKFTKESLTLHRIHNSNLSAGMRITSLDIGLSSFCKYIESILELENLKNRSFYEELRYILKIKNRKLQIVKYVYFQFKHRNIIYRKSFFSNLNKLRRLNIPHVPILFVLYMIFNYSTTLHD